MELLSPAIETVAAHRCVDAAIVLVVELISVAAIVLVGLAYVLQLSRYELQDDDIVEVADDRYLVRKNIFGVAEIHECGQDPFPVHLG